jgi:membrane fusion protein, multidrug efflux system
MKRRVLVTILPIAVLAVAAMSFLVLIATRSTPSPVAAEERAWPVAAVTVSHSDVQPRFHLFGEVVAGREVTMRALVAGVVTVVGENLVEGGIVRTGELLVGIDPFDYQAALDDRSAQLREAKARVVELEARLQGQRESLASNREQLGLLERDLERAETLRTRGTVSERFVDNARTAVLGQSRVVASEEASIAADMARVEQHKAQVARMEVALRQAQMDMSRTRLTAPFDGYLYGVAAAVGKRVGINDQIANIIAANQLEILLPISDEQYGRLIGSLEPVLVVRIGAQIDPTSRGVNLYAQIKATGLDSPLRPGAFLDVRMPERHYRDVARLPETAVDDGVVYAVVDGRLQPRNIEVLAREENDVFVRGEISDGEQIVTTRFPEIGPGVKVIAQ